MHYVSPQTINTDLCGSTRLDSRPPNNRNRLRRQQRFSADFDRLTSNVDSIREERDSGAVLQALQYLSAVLPHFAQSHLLALTPPQALTL